MSKPQIITTPTGERLVVLSERDYQALLARAGDEAAEDAMTERLAAEAAARLAGGEDVALPAGVWEAIEAGNSPVRAIRKHRGLTQADIAAAAGISQAYVAEIESGKKRGSADALSAIAKALGVPLDTLVD
jgi:DNA-binding XRE family transcriptional regulator